MTFHISLQSGIHLPTVLALTLAVGLAACGGGATEPVTAAATVTVGGTVSGLSTDGLVLTSGGESLTVRPSDSQFVFSSTVTAGSSYAIQIAHQPTTREQFCTIAGGSGTAGSSNLSSVAVTCRATEWTVSTLAGSGGHGHQDGVGAAASFSPPMGVTVDLDSNVYVADTSNHVIRRITPTGSVTTLAGSGVPGDADATGAAAAFNMPWRVSASSDGAVYVTDTYNQKIRKVSRAGAVTTIAGSGAIGSADGAAAVASFYYPFGVATAADGTLLVADNSSHTMRKVQADGTVSTFAGSGTSGFSNATGRAASFQSPYGIAVDRSGVAYVADSLNHAIRKISPAGVVTTLAGLGTRGYADGASDTALFSDPQGVAVDADGNVYVADTGNNVIRKVTPSGRVSTLAGSKARSVGFADGVGEAATFYFPFDVAVDRNGALYVADWGNLRIRKIAGQ